MNVKGDCSMFFSKKGKLNKQLLNAVKSDDNQALNAAIAQGADVNATNNADNTVLNWALARENFAAAHILVDQG
ncbi:MAG: hypothetical protein GF313_16925, partial [Caldithrix sp.]|nr:hypothetical protein [Caldithrix sp.]